MAFSPNLSAIAVFDRKKAYKINALKTDKNERFCHAGLKYL